MATKKLTTIVIDALEDIKARDINLINVSKLTSVFDYIAVASADSTRQTKALAKNVMEKVKESGGWIYGIEGEQSGEWVLVDCGDVVVHIMQPVMREHYKLEELWGEGKLEYPKPAVSKRKPAAAKAPDKTQTAAKVKARKPAMAPPKAGIPATDQVRKKKTTVTAVTAGKVKATVTKPKVAKPKVVKTHTVKTKAVKTKVVKKKVAAKVVTTTRKKAATPAVKKVVTKKPAVAKKPAARKPVVRRRKAASD
ncbi:MAG: ribosome silencing factor [Betaproteobacteria bacterium]